ncbi:MAG: thiamine pyrophosphate-binding protein [Halobacteriales archaeon]
MTTDTRTGADLFLDALQAYGVPYLFGNPGTTELPIMHSLESHELDYVLGLQEDIAMGMAAGYASARRYRSHHDPTVTPLGVVNLHVAPGLAHGLGNVYGADFAGAPVLVTAGNHPTDVQHQEPILSGDLEEMADQFCKWSVEVKRVGALPGMVRRAARTALTPPTGPVFLGLPFDVMTAETAADPEPLGSIPTAGRGDPAEIERAADFLVDVEAPTMIVGDHIARAGTDAVEAAVAFAEATGARVFGEFLSAEIDFPTGHPQWAGGLPGSPDGIRDRLESDTIVFVGCSSLSVDRYHEKQLFPPELTRIHINNAAREIGKNLPAEVAIFGDPGQVLDELTETLTDRLAAETRDRRREQARAAVERFRGTPPNDDTDTTDPRPSKGRLGEAIANAAGDALLVDESLTSRRAMQAQMRFAPEQYLANKGAGLGYGLPAAIGAALAERERDDPRDVVAYIGDGSYLYYPHAIYSAARYGVDLTVVIPDNRNYRILKENTKRFFGGTDADHEFTGMDFDPTVDFVKNAESHGATAAVIDDPDGIEDAIADAITTDGPVVLDVPIHD